MLVEQSLLLIKDGMEDEFDAVMTQKGLPLLRALDGVQTVTFGRGLENPEKFMLLIEWETMDAHTAFTRIPAFADFRALMAPYAKGGTMEHFNMR
jgi:heme-degrading monooxygenase HmoA